jgi:ribonuclease E
VEQPAEEAVSDKPSDHNPEEAPVTPGRAYNDPREARKRRREAEEAQKTEGSN